MKEIRAEFNPNYGNPIVSQKYSPLSNIALLPNFPYSEEIISNRKKILGSVASVKFTVLGELPKANSCPFIAVSSNRSGWIANKFLEIRKLGAELNLDMFTPYYDGPNVLFYDPLRTNRPLIVFVHNLELNKYLESFSELRLLESVVLVGWELPYQNNSKTLLGFGASRFAAIELFKHIGVERGWVVDDNVVQRA